MHLSIFQRTRIIDIYLHFKNVRHVCDIIKTVEEQYGIEISRWGVRDLIKKWKTFGSIQDRPMNNKQKLLITDEGLLAIHSNQFEINK